MSRPRASCATQVCACWDESSNLQQSHETASRAVVKATMRIIRNPSRLVDYQNHKHYRHAAAFAPSTNFDSRFLIDDFQVFWTSKEFGTFSLGRFRHVTEHS